MNECSFSTSSPPSNQDDLQILDHRGCLTLEALCFIDELDSDRQEAVKRHLRSCSICAQEHAALARTIDRLRRSRSRFPVPTEVSLLTWQIVTRSLTLSRQRSTQKVARLSPVPARQTVAVSSLKRRTIFVLAAAISLLTLALLLLLLSCKDTSPTTFPGRTVRPGTFQTEQLFKTRVTVGAAGPRGLFAAGTPDGQVLLMTSEHSVARLGQKPVHDGSITALAFSTDGKILLSAGGKTAVAWKIATRTLLRQVRGPQVITAATLEEPGQRAYFATREGHVLRWDLTQASAEALAGFACAGSLVPRSALRLPKKRRCPFGTYLEPESGAPMCAYEVTTLRINRGSLLRACREGTLGTLQLKTGQRSYYLAGYLKTITPLPRDQLLLGRAEGELRVYDPASKKVISELLPAGKPTAADQADGLVAVAQGQVIRFWELPDKTVRATVPAPGRIVWLALLPRPLRLRLLTDQGQLVVVPLTID